MNQGIGYYKELFQEYKHKFDDIKDDIILDLERIEFELNSLLHPYKIVRVS